MDETERVQFGRTATYDPGDDKLRLSAATRLSKEDYDRVKAAGFSWAPKQQVFYAHWTPDREDLLEEMAGEIGDEDTTLVDRAAERADRFEDYSDKRMADAERAKKAVDSIADNIPLGQPILVGHHSEKHARKDAERIESGMRKAVSMWRTAEYWKQRAAGALHHAQYKEIPAVRARRIKKLEAERRRKQERVDIFSRSADRWSRLPTMDSIKHKDGSPTTLHERALFLSGNMNCARHGAYSELKDNQITAEQAIDLEIAACARAIERAGRWLEHLDRRLEYERAMLAEAGGLAADRFEFEVGGRVLVRGEWVTVLKINRSAGKVSSLTTTRKYVNKVSVEKVEDYRPADPEDKAAAEAVMKLPPMVNYPGAGFHQITTEEWKKRHADYKGSRWVAASAEHGRHRVRTWLHRGDLAPAYLTDAKRVDPPPPSGERPPELPCNEIDRAELDRRVASSRRREETRENPKRKEFAALEAAARDGVVVQVVTANQLFPTPPEIARRMIDALAPVPGDTVLEPSAGTGNLLRALVEYEVEVFFGAPGPTKVTAVEISPSLAKSLDSSGLAENVICGDFTALRPEEIGQFDRILMNPPFENASDVRHILHARRFLKPGGTLVALCADGPRQNANLKPLADFWEPLAAGAFQSAGTNVKVSLLVIQG